MYNHFRYEWVGVTVKVEIVFLDVLAMVAFAVREPEQAFLQDRVAPVPKSECETENLVVIAKTREAVLAPAVGARAGLIVGEIVPGIARRTVIFPNRAPLAFGQIRAPLLPGCGARVGLL